MLLIPQIVTPLTADALNMKVSPVFLANYRATKRIVVNEGGSRSGKTHSILQVLVLRALNNTGLIIDIVRKTKAEMHATVLLDFIEILQDLNLYSEKMHNKTHDEFLLNGNLFRFIGLDKAQKKRGAKRNILYINEANGLTLEDWIQLSIRVEDQIFIDYNPSEYFWCHEHIIEKRPNDHKLIRSNYLDNYDFLKPAQIAEIENLVNVDEYYYQVYTLGNLAAMKGKIYNNYSFIDLTDYYAVDADEIFMGLDFGFEHANSLIEIKYAQEKSYENEVIHRTHQTDDELIKEMLDLEVSMTNPIYADPAYPASIRKLRDAGFNIFKAKKDVRDGIRFCQSIKTHITNTSVNYQKSISRYKWRQTSDGKLIDGEPVKIDDDPCDAARYGKYSHLKRLIGT